MKPEDVSEIFNTMSDEEKVQLEQESAAAAQKLLEAGIDMLPEGMREVAATPGSDLHTIFKVVAHMIVAGMTSTTVQVLAVAHETFQTKGLDLAVVRKRLMGGS